MTSEALGRALGARWSGGDSADWWHGRSVRWVATGVHASSRLAALNDPEVEDRDQGKAESGLSWSAQLHGS